MKLETKVKKAIDEISKETGLNLWRLKKSFGRDLKISIISVYFKSNCVRSFHIETYKQVSFKKMKKLILCSLAHDNVHLFKVLDNYFELQSLKNVFNIKWRK